MVTTGYSSATENRIHKSLICGYCGKSLGSYDIEDGKMKPWYLIDKPLFNDWCKPEEVEVKYLGETKVFRREGIVVANYNGILDLEQAGMMQVDVDEELIEAIDNYYFDVEDDIV